MKRTRRSAWKAGPNKGKIIYWLVGGLTVLLLGTAVFGRDGVLAVIVNQKRLEDLRSEIAELRENNLRMKKQIYSLRNDLTSVERIAREDLGLVKPGETVYEFIPEGDGLIRR